MYTTRCKYYKAYKGETISSALSWWSYDGVGVGRWRAKRTVNNISTEFDKEMVTIINKHRQEKLKPIAIVKYNVFMKGVVAGTTCLKCLGCTRISIQVLKMLLNNNHLFEMCKNDTILFSVSSNWITASKETLPTPGPSIEHTIKINLECDYEL